MLFCQFVFNVQFVFKEEVAVSCMSGRGRRRGRRVERGPGRGRGRRRERGGPGTNRCDQVRRTEIIDNLFMIKCGEPRSEDRTCCWKHSS